MFSSTSSVAPSNSESVELPISSSESSTLRANQDEVTPAVVVVPTAQTVETRPSSNVFERFRVPIQSYFRRSWSVNDNSASCCYFFTLRSMTCIIGLVWATAGVVDMIKNSPTNQCKNSPGCFSSDQSKNTRHTEHSNQQQLRVLINLVSGSMAYTGSQRGMANWLLPLLVFMTFHGVTNQLQNLRKSGVEGWKNFHTASNDDTSTLSVAPLELNKSIFKVIYHFFNLYLLVCAVKVVWDCYRHLKSLELIDITRNRQGVDQFLNDFLYRIEDNRRNQAPSQEYDSEPPKYEDCVGSLNDLRRSDSSTKSENSPPGYAEVDRTTSNLNANQPISVQAANAVNN